MTNPTQTAPTPAFARTAGSLYLIIAIFGGFSIGFVPAQIVVDGDAAATANNFLLQKNLFHMGIFADVVVILTEIILTAMLFVMFKPVSHTLSLAAAFARLAMIVVMGVNLLVYLIPALVLRDDAHLSSATPEQLQSVALLAFEAHQLGIYVWGILFSLHLAILGHLVIRSGSYPRILGLMMMIGSLGYVLDGLSGITGISNQASSYVVIGLLVLVTIGELSFALWLLITGGAQGRRAKQAVAA